MTMEDSHYTASLDVAFGDSIMEYIDVVPLTAGPRRDSAAIEIKQDVRNIKHEPTESFDHCHVTHLSVTATEAGNAEMRLHSCSTRERTNASRSTGGKFHYFVFSLCLC